MLIVHRFIHISSTACVKHSSKAAAETPPTLAGSVRPKRRRRLSLVSVSNETSTSSRQEILEDVDHGSSCWRRAMMRDCLPMVGQSSWLNFLRQSNKIDHTL